MVTIDEEQGTISLERHREIVAELQAKIDRWIDRSQYYSNKYEELRDRLPVMISSVKVIEYTMQSMMVQLKERVQEMEEQMRARFSD